MRNSCCASRNASSLRCSSSRIASSSKAAPLLKVFNPAWASVAASCAFDAAALSQLEPVVKMAEADAFSEGRKVRVTKVPFASTPKALINDDSRGFVKIVSDPATGVVLGGSIVGRHAAELISVLAIAVSNGLTVTDIHESLLVHPTLAEALSEAAE